MQSLTVKLEIHFMDDRKLTLTYDQDPTTALGHVSTVNQKEFFTERLVLETGGDLVVIPLTHVRYIRATPAPERLPAGVLKNVNFIEA